MTTPPEPPEVWVGCLDCYNDGHLLCGWYDAVTCPTDMADWSERGKLPLFPSAHYAESRGELWVFDHQGFHGAIRGECSPVEAQRVAAALLSAELGGLPAAAFGGWVHDGNGTIDDATDAADAFYGEYDSDRDFAESYADDLGLIDPDSRWPYSCIDWDHATRELMQDFITVDAPGGRVFVFRR